MQIGTVPILLLNRSRRLTSRVAARRRNVPAHAASEHFILPSAQSGRTRAGSALDPQTWCQAAGHSNNAIRLQRVRAVTLLAGLFLMAACSPGTRHDAQALAPLVPGHPMSLVVSVYDYPVQFKGRPVSSRKISNRTVVTRIQRELNALPLAPKGIRFCPADLPPYFGI